MLALLPASSLLKSPGHHLHPVLVFHFLILSCSNLLHLIAADSTANNLDNNLNVSEGNSINPLQQQHQHRSLLLLLLITFVLVVVFLALFYLLHFSVCCLSDAKTSVDGTGFSKEQQPQKMAKLNLPPTTKYSMAFPGGLSGFGGGGNTGRSTTNKKVFSQSRRSLLKGGALHLQPKHSVTTRSTGKQRRAAAFGNASSRRSRSLGKNNKNSGASGSARIYTKNRNRSRSRRVKIGGSSKGVVHDPASLKSSSQVVARESELDRASYNFYRQFLKSVRSVKSVSEYRFQSK